MKIYTRISFVLISLLLGFASSSLSAQMKETCCDHWIDKDEDENYTPRHECSFVQAGDHFILFGGRESARKLEMYDYSCNAWSAGGTAPKEFNHFQATSYKGFIWIIGSFKTNKYPREIPADTVWLYHIPSQKWIAGPEIPADRRRGGAGLVVHDDKFYVIAGNTIGHDGGYVNWFDEYDPRKNTWTPLSDAPQARDHFHAAVIDDVLYAAGGRLSGGEGGVFAPCLPKVDTYDFKTQEWSQLSAPLPTPRAAPGIAEFNGELFVMGGEGETPGPAFKLVEAYNPNTKEWTRKADMNYPRHGTQAIVSGSGIYMAAGSPKRGGGNQRNMEVYSKDAPEGHSLSASHFESISQKSIKPGKTKRITISNTGGNTGSFISKIEILGKGKANFKLLSNYDLHLIDANSKFDVQLACDDASTKDAATLKITYNGGEVHSLTIMPK